MFIFNLVCGMCNFIDLWNTVFIEEQRENFRVKLGGNIMIGWLIALISGALMSIQGVFNTEVTKQTSIWVANGWVQLTALLVCLIGWFVTGRPAVNGLWQMDQKYMLLGGVMGAGITWTVIQSMDKLGPAKAVMVIVVSQLFVAYLIEIFGIFGVEKVAFQWKKALGMALAVAGIILFKWE